MSEKTEILGHGQVEELYTIPVLGKYDGVPPAVVMLNPKYARNVGSAIRACSAWGLNQLWWTGKRVQMDIQNSQTKSKKPRWPREERMKGYSKVQMMNHERPFDFFKNAVPVAIELVRGSENLIEFVHPENAIYVFGPEDGGIDKAIRHLCHSFVQIPTHHCLNLAAAINVVLYDRRCKRIASGMEANLSPNDMLHEERGFANTEM